MSKLVYINTATVQSIGAEIYFTLGAAVPSIIQATEQGEVTEEQLTITTVFSGIMLKATALALIEMLQNAVGLMEEDE